MIPEPLNKELTIEQCEILYEEELEKAELRAEEMQENEIRDEVHPVFQEIFDKF